MKDKGIKTWYLKNRAIGDIGSRSIILVEKVKVEIV